MVSLSLPGQEARDACGCPEEAGGLVGGGTWRAGGVDGRRDGSVLSSQGRRCCWDLRGDRRVGVSAGAQTSLASQSRACGRGAPLHSPKGTQTEAELSEGGGSHGGHFLVPLSSPPRYSGVTRSTRSSLHVCICVRLVLHNSIARGLCDECHPQATRSSPITRALVPAVQPQLPLPPSHPQPRAATDLFSLILPFGEGHIHATTRCAV